MQNINELAKKEPFFAVIFYGIVLWEVAMAIPGWGPASHNLYVNYFSDWHWAWDTLDLLFDPLQLVMLPFYFVGSIGVYGVMRLFDLSGPYAVALNIVVLFILIAVAALWTHFKQSRKKDRPDTFVLWF